jgi:tetratricopeptide (TPR) repeat protein
MFHDEGRIEPAFSTLDVFSKWLKLNGGFRGKNKIDDDESYLTKLHRAQHALRQNMPEQTIEFLLQAKDQIPEISEVWLLLANQYFRLNNTDAAVNAALQAYCSTWSFGFSGNKVFQLLRRAARYNADASEPILKRIEILNVNFGGHKENNNYPIMKEIIKEYLDRNPIFALKLHQNYAYMMQTETTAFRERYGYDIDRWRDEHANLCQQYLGSDRRFAR